MRLAITTDRLTLRPPEDADADALARGLADFDVVRMTAMVPHPYPVEVAHGWVFLLAARRRRGQEHTFVIDVAGEGVSGCIGLFKRPACPDWEVGYWLAKPAWGRGLASEALAAVLDWARDDLGAPRVVAGYFDDNPASRRVLEKASFAPTGEISRDFSLARKGRVGVVRMARELAGQAHALDAAALERDS